MQTFVVAQPNNRVAAETRDKQDEIITSIGLGASTYNYIQSDAGATYKYYWYAQHTGWKRKRKTQLRLKHLK